MASQGGFSKGEGGRWSDDITGRVQQGRGGDRVMISQGGLSKGEGGWSDDMTGRVEQGRGGDGVMT